MHLKFNIAQSKTSVYIVIGLLYLSLLGWSCSTEKNTFLSRTYHNTTARYNIYFNAKESYKKGIKQAEASNTDSYISILPMFIISKPDAANSLVGEMDKTIKKSSKAIKFHSITAKPKTKSGKLSAKEKEFYNKKEFCKWVDDSYLLMGMAYFAKHDFFEARQNFEYLIRQFPKELVAYDAKIWLARTFSESQKYKSAKEIFDLIEADKSMPKKYQGQFAAAYADYYIKLGQYDDAIPKLKKAIKYAGKKSARIRYMYILAQLYEATGDAKRASEMYAAVAKKNPVYEMEFNARINIARLYSGTGGKEVRKKLRRMLKDDKNIEYLDQIYYAIAEIDYRDKKTDDAIKNYKLSSEKSMANNYQKALSCEKLGKIFYGRKDYINAQAYYDTCLANLPLDYKSYKEIQDLSNNLNDLVIELNTITLEDSLQKVAKMSEKDRNKLIDDIIADLIEEENRQRELEQEQQMNSMLFDQRRDGYQNNVSAPSGGKWYFYNPSQLSFGRNEFVKKWGNRKNEDHWRRKNKSVVSFDNETASTDSLTSDTLNTRKVSDNKKREYYLQDLPLTDSLIASSNSRIMDAFYNAGRIYKEQFEDFDQSIFCFNELNRRFPNNIYLLTSYYNLYLLHKIKGNASEMETYRNLIITKFPTSHYANLLQNPNYVNELKAKRESDIALYMNTYDAYVQGKCQLVNTNTNKYFSGKTEKDLEARFRFISALCVGKTMDEMSFKKALVDFIGDYPNDELARTAQDILSYFGSANIEELRKELAARPAVVNDDANLIFNTTTSDSLIAAEAVFKNNESVPHYYIILANADQIDINRLSFEVRNFNIFTFSLKNFTVMNMLFDDKYQMVIVKTFDNKRQSLNYMKIIKNNPDVFGRIESNDYKQFTISEENYQALKKVKNINLYLDFFETNYVNP
ncbi:MAG TPA: tetratricopeptide repeat protein [Bacteroidales bacterium]|nr:tetratricopeptide repeat protein [Bacteroidales bacterium]